MILIRGWDGDKKLSPYSSLVYSVCRRSACARELEPPPRRGVREARGPRKALESSPVGLMYLYEHPQYNCEVP